MKSGYLPAIEKLRALDPHDIVKPEYYFNSEAEAVGGGRGVKVVPETDTQMTTITTQFKYLKLCSFLIRSSFSFFLDNVGNHRLYFFR